MVLNPPDGTVITRQPRDIGAVRRRRTGRSQRHESGHGALVGLVAGVSASSHARWPFRPSNRRPSHESSSVVSIVDVAPLPGGAAAYCPSSCCDTRSQTSPVPGRRRCESVGGADLTTKAIVGVLVGRTIAIRPPVSTSGLDEVLPGDVLLGVVGVVVVPEAPDDLAPGAAEDAGGVGVAGASGAGAVVDVRGPGVVAAACVGEGAERGVGRTPSGTGRVWLCRTRRRRGTGRRRLRARGSWGSDLGSRRSRRSSSRRTATSRDR
jgi:hypothetical protein